jgi:hypothetical protein
MNEMEWSVKNKESPRISLSSFSGFFFHDPCRAELLLRLDKARMERERDWFPLGKEQERERGEGGGLSEEKDYPWRRRSQQVLPLLRPLSLMAPIYYNKRLFLTNIPQLAIGSE